MTVGLPITLKALTSKPVCIELQESEKTLNVFVVREPGKKSLTILVYVLLSHLKAYESVLSVYEDFCNFKQVLLHWPLFIFSLWFVFSFLRGELYLVVFMVIFLFLFNSFDRLISNSRSAGAHRPEEFLFNRQNPFQQTLSSLESAERVAQLGECRKKRWWEVCFFKVYSTCYSLRTFELHGIQVSFEW